MIAGEFRFLVDETGRVEVWIGRKTHPDDVECILVAKSKDNRWDWDFKTAHLISDDCRNTIKNMVSMLAHDGARHILLP